MKKIVVNLILFTVLFAITNAQYETRYGDYCNPKDTLRVLNIFINIDYDLCPDCDPVTEHTPNWPGAPGNSINKGIPVYLKGYMDTEFDPHNISGVFTKRFAEASFNQFVVLGDFIVVNIKQSYIQPSGEPFNNHALRDSTISLINKLGGLRTIYRHNSILDYDGTEISDMHRFQEKRAHYNDSIDFIQFYFRNSDRLYGTVYNGGRAENNSTKIKVPLLINGTPHFNDGGIVVGRLGNKDLSKPNKQSADVHELAHKLLGVSETMHMGGGFPITGLVSTTLNFNNGGWSIIGSANSSLISCNGYERWRLDWRGPDNQAYRIACKNQNSDIEKQDGSKTYFLRDFVSTGDVIRIKLPYIDSGALVQYIWLENHQIHTNGKEDYPPYWKEACKDDGIGGIYAYYQVGKDDLIGDTIRKGERNMLPSFVDHLVPISAEGNWDYKLLQDKDNCCIAWKKGGTNIQEYYRENPLSGYNDLRYHYFNSSSTNTFDFAKDEIHFFIKKKNGQIIDNLPSLGDNLDPFTNNTQMSISSNPAPVNVVTYHHFRLMGGKIDNRTRLIDNRKIHLSGLKIDFKVRTLGEMQVDVRWDYYDIDNSVLWAGDIILHEKLNLLSDNKITLDQNQTPNKHIRDEVTGLFAGPTYFTSLNNSEFTMQPESEVEMKNLSSFILEPGSRLEINDNSLFTVNGGCTLVIQDSAIVQINGSGRIDIEENACICIEPGAKIILQDPLSVLNLHPGYKSGVNTAVLREYNCSDEPAGYVPAGKGKINNYMQIVHIQDEIISTDRYLAGSSVDVGMHVTSSKSQGDVYATPEARLIIDAEEDVLLDEGCTIEEGADLEIR